MDGVKARYGKIGVLMGGPSTEREISLKSGKTVYASLAGLGVEVVAIDVTTAGRDENAALFASAGIDCAFIALHGYFGEDGQVQEILDVLGIPYTGSGVSASRLAMDKDASRRIFARAGLKVPRSLLLDKGVPYRLDSVAAEIGLPAVIKPAGHGSSIGLSIIDDAGNLAAAIKTAFGYDPRVLVEEYLPGREVTVGVLDDEPLPVIEVIPKKRFFDYEAKYQAGMTDYVVPAELDDQVTRQAQSAGRAAHRLLGCSGCSRVDMILSKGGEPFILEVNTIPGMTETSLLPKAARVAGIDFSRLCLRLIDRAYEKAKNKNSV